METREQVFEQLIKEKLGMLRGTAMRILGSPADVDDAVQQALLAAWQKYDAFRGQSEFATWVTRILLNVCYDMVRDRARERSVFLPCGHQSLLNSIINVRRTSEDPHRGPAEHPEFLFDQLFKDLFSGFHKSLSTWF